MLSSAWLSFVSFLNAPYVSLYTQLQWFIAKIRKTLFSIFATYNSRVWHEKRRKNQTKYAQKVLHGLKEPLIDTPLRMQTWLQVNIAKTQIMLKEVNQKNKYYALRK